MISESIFDDNDKRRLDNIVLDAEMAVPDEWIVRDAADPDNLILVSLKPCDDGTIRAHCSCPEGSANRKCLHSLKVINEIKSQTWLLRQLFAPPADANVAVL